MQIWSDVVALVWRNRTPRGRVAIGVLAVVVAIAAVGPGGGAEDRASGRNDPTAHRSTTSSTPQDPSTTSELAGRTTSTTSTTNATRPTGSEVSGPTGAGGTSEGLRVTSVVDGDTLRVAGGDEVRLVGIDTPERGACGYSEATAALRSLVGEGPVRLVPGARDDTDRYGRLLRYVEAGEVDANLEMIRSGHAVARYDSRDGYGRHPREDRYVAADRASPRAGGCPGGATPTTTVAPPASGGGTDPGFGTCREAKSHGLGPYRRGVDPEYDWYRDADADGLVCE